MSEQNVDTVRRVIDAFSARDPEAAIGDLAPDVEWEPAVPSLLEKTVHRGPEEVTEGMAALWETWEEFRLEESEVRDLGDEVLWLGQAHMRGGASEIELDQEFSVYAELRGGRLRRARAFLSWREGLEAAGLEA